MPRREGAERSEAQDNCINACTGVCILGSPKLISVYQVPYDRLKFISMPADLQEYPILYPIAGVCRKITEKRERNAVRYANAHIDTCDTKPPLSQGPRHVSTHASHVRHGKAPIGLRGTQPNRPPLWLPRFGFHFHLDSDSGYDNTSKSARFALFPYRRGVPRCIRRRWA